MSIKVIMYTAENCPNCTKTKDWLNHNNVPFEIKDITNDEETRVELRDKGFRALPVIEVFEKGELIYSWASFNEKNLDWLSERYKKSSSVEEVEVAE